MYDTEHRVFLGGKAVRRDGLLHLDFPASQFHQVDLVYFRLRRQFTGTLGVVQNAERCGSSSPGLSFLSRSSSARSSSAVNCSSLSESLSTAASAAISCQVLVGFMFVADNGLSKSEQTRDILQKINTCLVASDRRFSGICLALTHIHIPFAGAAQRVQSVHCVIQSLFFFDALAVFLK